MYFNVAQLLKEPVGSTRSYEVDEQIPPLEGLPVSRIKGSIRMLKTDKSIWVSASLHSQTICACSRCLEDYDQPIHMDLEEEFLPLVDINSGMRLEFSEYDENFRIGYDNILDLIEAARQYFTINLPMKPVCHVDCAGICPQCGVNLNHNSCRCDRELRDPKWRELLELVSVEGHEN